MATLTEILVNLMRYQVQLYNNLSDYCLLCALPHRCDTPTPRRHSSPPFSDVPTLPSHSVTQPVFTEAMLMDTINGTIHLRDLPLCVRTSATISAFCINTLADPPELNIIRGLDKHFIHHILRHVIRNHMYIDELISGTNIPLLNVRPDKLLLLRSMKHTLNRATNMVVQHLNEHQRSQFLPRRTPRAFSDIDDAFHDDPPDCPMETRCAVAIIYALRLLYITHHRNYFNRDHGLAEHYFYPDHLFAIAKEIKSTAAALSLLPDTTTFNLLPRFVHDAFDEVDDLFPGTSLGHRSDQYYRDKLPYLQTEFELVQPYVTDYINSFPTPSTEAKEIASDRACELINVALFQHAIIHRMSKKRSKQPELNNNQVFIGNLPPADMFLSSFATCYPMITTPSDVQLTFDNRSLQYMEIYNRLTPIATDTVNDSIDFLPHFEYVLFRVVQLLHPKDPTGIIRENYPPTNVVIFQGSPLQAPTYCFGSPTEIAIPTPTTGAFPINLDHSGDPIIVNNISVNDPDWIPRHTADLRRHPDADLYHVACDPKRIPFSLAVRLIPVYTTGPSGQTIYQAWALPHLNNALRDPELQLFNNFLSYYHTAKENHPEFPFIDLMGSDSPVPNYGILTPKNVKLPHNPDATNSNPQPPISTTFSTTPKIIPTKKFSPQNLNPQPPNPSQNLSQPQNQHNKIIQPPSTKSAKPTQKSPNFGNDDQNPQNAPKSVATRPTPRQATHATFTYPPVETFFDEDTDHDSEEEPKHIQHTSPDALTSSTRTDFTYPPIEDLTKTLLKYAKNANLRKLAYPTDLQARRRHLTPSLTTLNYARTAILTLRRHCAPLTPDHVERTREAFCSIKQPHHEVATSYLNRIRLLTRDCYHAGIPNTDAELIKRTVRGGSNHSFYAASYQRFDADIRRAELNDEALPPFAELESHLLNIDESRGLTLPSQNHRNYNQHANAARGHHSHHFQPRHNQTTQRVFTQRQQQAFSSILRPYSNPSSNNQNRNQPPRPPQNHSRPFRPPTNPSRPPFNNSNQRRPPPPSRGHPTSLNETIDHLSDRRPVLINVHL
ncbi:hypothetical protein MHU86_14101 [Fragilaria crotonensis]|nr:hypothetical protein MHU86_14101 [Fragilaria crotonensis]